MFQSVGFQLALDAAGGGAGDGHGVVGHVQSGGGVGGFGGEHAIAGFRGAAGFGNHHAEGVFQGVPDFRQHAVQAVRIRVVEKVGAEGGGPVVDQRGGGQLRPECAPADADDEEAGEPTARGRGDAAGVHVRGEGQAVSKVAFDFGSDFRGGGEGRGAQPVVPDHSAFVGVGDGALFEGGHVGEGFGAERSHTFEVAVGKSHAADIERKAGVGVAEKGILE